LLFDITLAVSAAGSDGTRVRSAVVTVPADLVSGRSTLPTFRKTWTPPPLKRERLSGLDFVRIPEGIAVVGCRSDGTNCDRVSLREFQIGRTEVSWAAFDACIRAGACTQTAHPDRLLDRPATHVTWDEANTFCRWIGGRLPTEHEWERAARGPSDRDARISPWGDSAPTCEQAQFHGCTPSGPTAILLRPAGASPEGVLDLVGNVREWVADEVDRDASGRAKRVLRGGSFATRPDQIRISKRDVEVATHGVFDPTAGFRCVR
jgi:formylglycine-generating enzyme required for sulfatase activity